MNDMVEGAEALRVWSDFAACLEAAAAGVEEAAGGPGGRLPDLDLVHELAVRATGSGTRPGSGTGPAGIPRDTAARLRDRWAAEALGQALREVARAVPATGRHACCPAVVAASGAMGGGESGAPADDGGSDGGGARQTVFDGARGRLVVMTLRPGEATGHEIYEADQLLLLLTGEGECAVDGHLTALGPRDALHVPAGALFTVRNTGTRAMRIGSVRVPSGRSAATGRGSTGARAVVAA